MSDIVDYATEQIELVTTWAVRAAATARREVKVTGRCANCDATVAPDAAFCDADCRDDYGWRVRRMREQAN